MISAYKRRSMDALLLAIIIGVFYYFSTRKKKKSNPALHETGTPVKLPVSPGSASFEETKIDTGEIIEAVPGEFTLNPKAPLQLTLRAHDKVIAQEIKDCFDDGNNLGRNNWKIVFLLARYNIICKQIEEYASTNRKVYLETIETLRRGSDEWISASEKGRADLLIGFKDEASEKIKEAPPKKDLLKILFEEEPSDMTADDKLLNFFEDDMETYGFFITQLGYADKVRIVPADGYYRKKYENLTEKNFARHGLEIDLIAILESLRLKDINEAVKDLIEKPFRRKARGIEFAASVPDIKERLSNIVSFGELFQIVRPDGVDVEEIIKCYRYTNAVVELLEDTYRSGRDTLRTTDDGLEFEYDFWEISADSCCEACKPLHGLRTNRIPVKLPPFHVGCNCSIHGHYKSDV
jgi:hypothetical protein